MIRRGTAGVGLGLFLILGVCAPASAGVVGSAGTGAVSSAVAGIRSEDPVEARESERTQSGVALAGTGIGFLMVGAGAVLAAQRRRWGAVDVHRDASTCDGDVVPT